MSERTEARIAELKSVEAMTVRWHEVPMDKLKQRHAEKIIVRKGASPQNADCLINDSKVSKPDSVEGPVEQNMNLARFKEHERALQHLVNTNVGRQGTLNDAMEKIRELLESGRLIDQ